jgi:hypothetical protein
MYDDLFSEPQAVDPALAENEMIQNSQRSMTAGWLGVHTHRLHEAVSLPGMLNET